MLESIKFEHCNTVIAESQEQYGTLHGLKLPGPEEVIITCWKPSWKDIFRMIWYRKLWMRSLTFGFDFTPMNLGTRRKDFYSLPSDKK